MPLFLSFHNCVLSFSFFSYFPVLCRNMFYMQTHVNPNLIILHAISIYLHCMNAVLCISQFSSLFGVMRTNQIYLWRRYYVFHNYPTYFKYSQISASIIIYEQVHSSCQSETHTTGTEHMAISQDVCLLALANCSTYLVAYILLRKDINCLQIKQMTCQRIHCACILYFTCVLINTGKSPSSETYKIALKWILVSRPRVERSYSDQVYS